MRIIQLRVDDTLFKKMEKDKNDKLFTNWEKYAEWLFNGRGKMFLQWKLKK